MIKDSIFIPIAACEEKYIELTIKSALANAKSPEKIFFGVFNNIVNQKHSLLNNKFLTKNEQILYTELITPCPMGVGFGRMNASLLQFEECEYIFQIDSHTLFTKNWDENIIFYFNKIKDEEKIDKDKLILSANGGLSWTYDVNNSENIYIVNDGNFLDKSSYIKIDPLNLEKTFEKEINQGLVSNKFIYSHTDEGKFFDKEIGFPIVYGDDRLFDLDYKESAAVHATFMFSTSKLNREVLHDPEDFFHGDQTNYSIRLLSRGYRIFTPKQPVLAVLNKIYNNEFLDPLYNWRSTIPYTMAGARYVSVKNYRGIDFFNNMISGKYFGYWGTPDIDSLNFVKKIIGYYKKNA